ncbi:MAG: response regulator [Sphingomonadaceae bacterium]
MSVPSKGDARLAVVVEDDDSVREMLCELLRSIGFEVASCRDGSEGLRAARELRPSVLTLDLHMPDMDGFEVLSRLRDDEATAGLPVVLVSAYVSDRQVRECRQVKAVVSKPFDVDELCEKVCSAAGVGQR